MHNADVLHEALTQANMITRKVGNRRKIFHVIEYRAKDEELHFCPWFGGHDDNAEHETLDRLCDDETLKVFKISQLATN